MHGLACNLGQGFIFKYCRYKPTHTCFFPFFHGPSQQHAALLLSLREFLLGPIQNPGIITKQKRIREMNIKSKPFLASTKWGNVSQIINVVYLYMLKCFIFLPNNSFRCQVCSITFHKCNNRVANLIPDRVDIVFNHFSLLLRPWIKEKKENCWL